jgi:hypothetical protein
MPARTAIWQRRRALNGQYLATGPLPWQHPLDALKPKDREELDFSSIYTTSYRDPIFNNVYQREWIDHILYSNRQPLSWVQNAEVNENMPDERRQYGRSTSMLQIIIPSPSK